MTMPYEAKPARPPLSKGLNIALWGIQILMGLAFLMFGGSKLASIPAVVQAFDKLGLGQWFRYLTGSLEMLGAILLFMPTLCGAGALLICCIMVGAVISHLTRLGGNPGGAIVFLLLAIFVAWFRRDRIMKLLGR